MSKYNHVSALKSLNIHVLNLYLKLIFSCDKQTDKHYSLG